MNIISVSAEVAPWSKTGGLGDVCGTLPVALAKRGHRVMTVAPRYEPYPEAWNTNIEQRFNGHTVGYYHCQDRGVDRVFIDHPALGRGGIYGGPNGGYNDNWFRFSLLCQAALLAAIKLPFNGRSYDYKEKPVFLIHDWHAALLPAYLKTAQHWGLLQGSSVALVIHNLAHQCVLPASHLGKLNLPGSLYSALDMGGSLNVLKGGLALSNKLITVSPSYAEEICTPEFGMGLESVLQWRQKDLYGILNGIDTNKYNPVTDKSIASNFSADNLKGKSYCKMELQKTVGLPVDPNVPLFGFVSRLDFQKGVDLIESVFPWLLQKRAQIILLGTGDPKLEEFLRKANRHPNVAGMVQFSSALAKKITAGSDFLLMPSRFEPCGLSQQHALQYGTIPIVHATGGLRDTVQSFNPWKGEGNGWAFSPLNSTMFKQALHYALYTYFKQKKQFIKLQQRAMQQERSWDRAAGAYEKVLMLSQRQ
jgi:starch synthase